MKNKLRKITVNGSKYLWLIHEKFIGVENTPDQYSAIVKAKIFKEGLKNNPLTVIFNVMEDAIVGTLITSSSTEINIHRPKNIRMLIEEGIKLGWIPEESPFIVEDGKGIYKQYGFNIDDI